MTLTERIQLFFGKGGSGSKNAAKNRLLLVLQEDRLGLTGEKKEALRKDILAAIRKHLDIDAEGFTMEFMSSSADQKEMRVTAPVQLGRAAANISK